MRIIAVALLDEAIEHRRDAERSSTARCLRYLHLPRRLQLAAAVKKLASNRRPVLFQVGPSASKLMLSIPAAPLLALTCASALLGLARSTNASRVRSRHRPDFAIDGRRAAAWLARRAFAAILATPRRSPAVRSSAFSTRLPDMPLPVLDGSGLRDQVPARPTGEGLVSRSCSSGRGFAPRCFRAPPRGYPRFRKAWVAAEGAGRPRPVRNISKSVTPMPSWRAIGSGPLDRCRNRRYLRQTATWRALREASPDGRIPDRRS